MTGLLDTHVPSLPVPTVRGRTAVPVPLRATASVASVANSYFSPSGSSSNIVRLSAIATTIRCALAPDSFEPDPVALPMQFSGLGSGDLADLSGALLESMAICVIFPWLLLVLYCAFATERKSFKTAGAGAQLSLAMTAYFIPSATQGAVSLLVYGSNSVELALGVAICIVNSALLVAAMLSARRGTQRFKFKWMEGRTYPELDSTDDRVPLSLKDSIPHAILDGCRDPFKGSVIAYGFAVDVGTACLCGGLVGSFPTELRSCIAVEGLCAVLSMAHLAYAVVLRPPFRKLDWGFIITTDVASALLAVVGVLILAFGVGQGAFDMLGIAATSLFFLQAAVNLTWMIIRHWIRKSRRVPASPMCPLEIPVLHKAPPGMFGEPPSYSLQTNPLTALPA